uniref:Reverse transcriptase domain-containing protein n=1 Tax=Tanacetum cinerariifolium TaxID=118510 RepID=A0A6L2JVH9_TANCI|nr:hypothetical protein [Tanacetum cinerariifolium]
MGYELLDSSEGVGITPEVPDESTRKFTTSSEGADDSHQSDDEHVNEDEITWVSTNDEEKANEDDEEEDDDRSIDIEETDDERIDLENDDQVMDDAVKNDVEKAEEEKDADKEPTRDEQAIKNQADDDIVGTLVTMSQKEKPEVPPSSFSHSLSSNYGNQFLNISSDTSLVSIIKDHTYTKINSLLDIPIQQEIPSTLSVPLLDVLVSVILPPTTTTPIPLTTPLPAPSITSEAPRTKVDHSEATEASVQANVINEEKKRPRKDTQPSNKSSTSKESSKGKTQPKTSKSGKSITVEEPDEEHVNEVSIDVKENIVHDMGNTDEQPNGEAAPKTDNAPKTNWFKQPPRPPTPDPECPYDISNPLLLKGRLGHLTVPVEHFFNKDLEHLKSENLERKYTTLITKTKAASIHSDDGNPTSANIKQALRQDFITIEDFRDFPNEMMYTVQEIFFILHQVPRLDDHARTFSSLLLARVDKRNLNPLKMVPEEEYKVERYIWGLPDSIQGNVTSSRAVTLQDAIQLANSLMDQKNCPKCGHPVNGHYCQGCALLRKKFKEHLFTYGIEHGILQDSSEPSNDNTNVANAPREPFVVNQDPDKNSSQSPPQINHHCCYDCGDPLEVPIIPNPEPFNNQTIKELPPTVQSFDPKSNLVHTSPNVFDPPSQLPFYSCDFYENDARYGHYYTPQVPFIYLEPCYNQDFNFPQKFQDFHDFQQKIFVVKIARLLMKLTNIPVCYDDDDDDYAFAITPNEPINSLSMGDEHLDTVPAMKSDEFIKSSVKNLFPNPSESKDENKCDVPACEEFTTFSNILFDSDNDFYSSDDQSFSDEDFPKEIYSNPLFDEDIVPMKIDPHHFNAESDLIESMLNHDSSIISSSNIDSLFDEFTGELTLLKLVPLGIDETDCHPEEETHFVKRLLYDNSSPRPPKEFVSENSDAEIESFSPSPILVEDTDSLMEEIDLSFTLDYPMPPGIEDDDYDSKRDILISEELLSNDSLSLPENESFHFDIPSSFCPPAKPPDGNTRILNVKMMGDISEQKVPMPRLMITLVSNQEKSPDLLSHLGLETFQPSDECPMMIHGKNTPILEVLLFHFYPP